MAGDLYLPNRKMRSHYYVPRNALLPAGGNVRIIAFSPPSYPQFGGVQDLGSAEGTFTFTKPFMLQYVAGVQVMSDASAPPGFRLQWSQVHLGKQKLAHNKEILNPNCVGSGKFPLWVQSLDLFDVNDVLSVQVKSLAKLMSAVTSLFDIAFIGVEIT